MIQRRAIRDIWHASVPGEPSTTGWRAARLADLEVGGTYRCIPAATCLQLRPDGQVRVLSTATWAVGKVTNRVEIDGVTWRVRGHETTGHRSSTVLVAQVDPAPHMADWAVPVVVNTIRVPDERYHYNYELEPTA